MKEEVLHLRMIKEKNLDSTRALNEICYHPLSNWHVIKVRFRCTVESENDIISILCCKFFSLIRRGLPLRFGVNKVGRTESVVCTFVSEERESSESVQEPIYSLGSIVSHYYISHYPVSNHCNCSIIHIPVKQ